MLIFADGPLAGEWHHIPAVILALPSVTFIVMWIRERNKK